MEHVEATEPITSFGGEPQLPPEPSFDDQRAMQAKLRSHGSRAVADALHEFTKHVRTFQMHVSTFRKVRDHQPDIQDVVTQMSDARQAARDAQERLEGLVSDELAAL